MRTALGRACGVVGWAPDTFWNAQYYEVRTAVDAHERTSLEHGAQRAAWAANGMRAAFHAEDFDALGARDFYDPTPDATAQRMNDEAEALGASLPHTL